MTTFTKFARHAMLLGSAAALALSAGVLLAPDAGWASDGGEGGAKVMAGKSGTAGHGGQQGQVGGKGQGRSMNDLFRSITGEEDDSDAPAWAGAPGGKTGMGGGKPASAGAKKGDLFGDLYVILRDANGIPILSEDGFVQPIDADGNLIPLDEEGAPIDATLAQEVELGRLNVGRAPLKVLDRRADEVIALLNEATALTVDAAGRLVLTVDGVEKTIDSPLENLALYVALMTTGTIPGVNDLPGEAYDFLVDNQLTAEDLAASTAFLAAATDKTSAFTVDEIAYIDAFLGINTVTEGSVTWSVVDYAGFTYDRSDAYGDVMVTVLVEQPDGTWSPTEVSVYEAVFGNEDFTSDDASGIALYTQAADDSRSVIEFIHEYAVPVSASVY